MALRRELLLLLAAITACKTITGTPMHAMSGKWGLYRDGGHTLPVFLYYANPGDSTFLVADTLSFDGRGGFTDFMYVASRATAAPQREWFPGKYELHGDTLVLYRSEPDVGWRPTQFGRRIANTLIFPVDSGSPAEIYSR